MKKLAKLLRYIDALSINAGKAFSYIILVVVALEATEVFLRYGLNKPTDWIGELSVLLAGAVFVIGGAWVHQEGKHVRTDVIFAHLSRKAQALVDVVLFFIVFLSFISILIWKSISNAIYSWSISETTFTMWAPPLYPLKTIIAVSFILLALQGLAKLIRDLTFLIKGEEL